MSQVFRLSIAAVNFDQTVFDTDDLSTIRGSSWTALALCGIFPKIVESEIRKTDETARVATVSSGASSCDLRIKTALRPDTLLPIVAEVVEGRNEQPDGGDELTREFLEIRPHMRFAWAILPQDQCFTTAKLVNAVRRGQYTMLDVPWPKAVEPEEVLQQIAKIEEKPHRLDVL